jgi:hypothetical protein
MIKAFYFACNDGRFQDAEPLLSAKVRKQLKSAGGIKRVCDANSRNRTLTAVELISEDVKASTATVTLKLLLKGGGVVDNDVTILVREGTSWRIDAGG